MSRNPFDPDSEGLRKVEHRQGDILDRASVDALARDVDVLVHLAFIIFTDKIEARRINLQGSRNVFEAAFEAGVQRLIYTSSVAAYGWHDDNPEWLTEEIEPAGQTSIITLRTRPKSKNYLRTWLPRLAKRPTFTSSDRASSPAPKR